MKVLKKIGQGVNLVKRLINKFLLQLPNMTPKQLLNDIKRRGWITDDIGLTKYEEEDCVIAYVKNSFGVCFVIKGKKTYFAYMCNRYSHPNYDHFNFWKIKLNEACIIIENDKDPHILYENIWHDFKKYITMKAI